MSKAVVSIGGSQASFHYCDKTSLHPQNTNLELSSHHISFFTTHLSKPVFYLKTRSGYNKNSPKAMNRSVYMTTETETLYDLLGISDKGTLLEIKKAYKQLARKYHPDVSPPELTKEYTKMFIQIQEAYETLSDPTSRALYDRDFARGLHMGFSAKKRSQYSENFDGILEWRNQWQSQLEKLKSRSMYNDSTGDCMSWGARMRRRRSYNKNTKS